jgi:hypothetical protein
MQEQVGVAREFAKDIKDVSERKHCEVCKYAMHDPVHLQVRKIVIMTGCRKCITSLKEKGDASHPHLSAATIG